MKLTPYDVWMVNQNVDRARIEGKDVVIARLRDQGYNMVADEVEHLLTLETAVNKAIQ